MLTDTLLTWTASVLHSYIFLSFSSFLFPHPLPALLISNSSFTDGSGFFAVQFTLRGVPSSASVSSLSPLGISFQLQTQIIQPVFGFHFTASDSPAPSPGNRFGYKTIIASGSQLLGPTDFEYVYRCFQAASVGATLLTSSAGPTAVGFYRSVPAAVRCRF